MPKNKGSNAPGDAPAAEVNTIETIETTGEAIITAETALGDSVVEVPVVEAAEAPPAADAGDTTDAPTADAGDAAAPTAEKAPAAKKERKLRTDTNSHKVRLFIGEAKQMKDDNGEPIAEKDMQAHVVERAVNELKMAKPLAKVYVKNNWAKA